MRFTPYLSFFGLFVFVALLSIHAAATEHRSEDAKTIVFIGNSFTFGAGSAVQFYRTDSVTDLNGNGRGGVPALFKAFTQQAGLDFDVFHELIPGSGLDRHLAEKTDVLGRSWDYVNMHGYSTLDRDKPGDPSTLIRTAKEMTELLRKYNPDVQIYLEATWSRADQTYPENGHWHGKSIYRMAKDVRAGYDLAAASTPFIKGVVPVGEAWNRAMAANVADPNPYDGIDYGKVSLWTHDYYHGGTYGYYLAALVIFGDITGLDPRSLGEKERCASELGLSRSQAAALQQVAFDELSAASHAHKKAELDQYGGWTGIKGKRTGFFHVQEIDGRHWFVTPDGNVFYPVALSHMLSGETRQAAQTLFGDDKEAWIRDSVAKAREMGFNSALGGASSPERNLNGYVDLPLSEKVFEEEKFPYAVGVILLKHPWEFVEGETLPDIFDPAYKQLIEDRAKAACIPAKDNPLVLGYYYGFGAFNHSQDWINHHMSLPANSHGRKAITDLLDKRYQGNVKEFNKIYGMKLNKISDLKTKALLVYEKDFGRANYPAVGKRLDPRKLDDFNAIVAHMCIHLYKMAHTAIRRYDTNHLILGSFIKEWALTGRAWKAAAPYLDLIAPQHWNESFNISDLSDAAGLPMIVSDEDVGFHYPNNGGNMYKGLISHDARGEIYQATLMRHYKDPRTMGATFCMCLYDQELAVVHKDQETGIYTIDGEPRPDLISRIHEINTEVYLHSPHPASDEELAVLDDELRRLWEEHDIKAHLKIK